MLPSGSCVTLATSPYISVISCRKGAAINYGVNRVRFPIPVRAGVRLRGCFELVGAAERNGALQVVERFTVELESGGKPACVAEIVRLLFFD